jgi:hypothetical protein
MMPMWFWVVGDILLSIYLGYLIGYQRARRRTLLEVSAWMEDRNKEKSK